MQNQNSEFPGQESSTELFLKAVRDAMSGPTAEIPSEYYSVVKPLFKPVRAYFKLSLDMQNPILVAADIELLDKKFANRALSVEEDVGLVMKGIRSPYVGVVDSSLENRASAIADWLLKKVKRTTGADIDVALEHHWNSIKQQLAAQILEDVSKKLTPVGGLEGMAKLAHEFVPVRKGFERLPDDLKGLKGELSSLRTEADGVEQRIQEAVKARDLTTGLKATFKEPIRKAAITYASLASSFGLASVVGFICVIVAVMRSYSQIIDPDFLPDMTPFRFGLVVASKLALFSLFAFGLATLVGLTRVFLHSAMNAWHRLGVLGALEDIGEQKINSHVKLELQRYGAQELFRPYDAATGQSPDSREAPSLAGAMQQLADVAQSALSK